MIPSEEPQNPSIQEAGQLALRIVAAQPCPRVPHGQQAERRAVEGSLADHLALLRHAQRHWNESAVLCRALLGQKLGSMQGIGKPARLMLADALLEMGDVRGAGDAIAALYQQRLSLAEVLKLVAVQIDHQARLGAWPEIFAGVTAKVQLAELMPAAAAARTQALLALAAKKTGREDWSDWLRRRAELLADFQQLATDRPVLWELWERKVEG